TTAGLLHLTAGNSAAAGVALEEALRLASERPLPAYALALAFGTFDEADRRFPALREKGRDRGLVGNPARAIVRREAAFHLAQQGDDARALAWLDRALAL